MKIFISSIEHFAAKLHSGRVINGSFFRAENDIALLKLKERIKFSNFVSPICLNLKRWEENHGSKLKLSGWEATENS